MNSGGSGEQIHVPVLPEEVIDLLDPKPGGVYIDATAGGGGHSRRILEATGPDGFLLGLDKDKEILGGTEKRLSSFGKRVLLRHGDFGNLSEIALEAGIDKADGILFDLGFSTFQLETSDRGFSYSEEGPLDMRLDRTAVLSAAEIVNGYPRDELIRIFRDYSDERRPDRVADAILEARSSSRIENTLELAGILRGVSRGRKGTRHPEAALFQAVRIEVNSEFDSLRNGLAAAARILKPGGRLCVISFHSGEDRIVKRTFLGMRDEGIMKIVTKKPVCAGRPEQVANPKSRSAKLRCAERV